MPDTPGETEAPSQHLGGGFLSPGSSLGHFASGQTRRDAACCSVGTSLSWGAKKLEVPCAENSWELPNLTCWRCRPLLGWRWPLDGTASIGDLQVDDTDAAYAGIAGRILRLV